MGHVHVVDIVGIVDRDFKYSFHNLVSRYHEYSNFLICTVTYSEYQQFFLLQKYPRPVDVYFLFVHYLSPQRMLRSQLQVICYMGLHPQMKSDLHLYYHKFDSGLWRKCATLRDQVCQINVTSLWFFLVLRFPPPIKLSAMK